MKWRPCPSENGDPLKMEVSWIKQQATTKKYCESTPENDRARKCNVKQVARA